jgi:hypothetical protein
MHLVAALGEPVDLPSAGGGSGRSAISSEPGCPGITLIALMVTELIQPDPS